MTRLTTVLGAIALAACTSSAGPEVTARSAGETVTGMASWYGPDFHGRLTASGERFDMNGLTAAHPTLPLGTRVRVTNVANGKSVVVRINDRGPVASGRVIDLSLGAAQAIGLTRSGVGQVKIEVLEKG